MLNFRQLRFVEGVVAGLSNVEAYKAAGYQARGRAAIVNASRMLTNADISEAIEAARKKAADKTGVTADRVLGELAKIAFESAENGANQGAANGVAVKTSDRIAALRLLAQHLGLFDERKQDGRPQPSPVQICFPNDGYDQVSPSLGLDFSKLNINELRQLRNFRDRIMVRSSPAATGPRT
jgi:phage terminase small subunit